MIQAIKMNSFKAIFVLLLISALIPSPVFAQEQLVKANVTISVQQAGEIWTGQQVTINLDLKTTGFSFSDINFNLPEIAGAFLMQIDTTTVKLSESVEGQRWQIMRYPLALYPQKSGLLEIPPISVRFSTSAGFDSVKKNFIFESKVLQLTINTPPGVQADEMVISTSSFQLEYEWLPESQINSPSVSQAGDAFTLKVKRRANGISAMLFPPLPVFRAEGLAAYPQASEVNDKTNRGELIGERLDSITWIAEKPGAYHIPGIRFQWWDPRSKELNQQVIPGLILDILPGPETHDVADAAGGSEGSGSDYLFWLIPLIITLGSLFFWYQFRHKTATETVETESSAFTSLQKACKSNQPVHVYSALNRWLSWFSLSSYTLAQASNDPMLNTQLKGLQTALVSPDKAWQGDALLVALRHYRGRLNKQKTSQFKVTLLPLNP